jgi:Ca2+-binding EF-hand superfamily protein
MHHQALLSTREMAPLRTAFMTLDVDHSGAVSMSELAEHVSERVVARDWGVTGYLKSHMLHSVTMCMGGAVYLLCWQHYEGS